MNSCTIRTWTPSVEVWRQKINLNTKQKNVSFRIRKSLRESFQANWSVNMYGFDVIQKTIEKKKHAFGLSNPQMSALEACIPSEF